MGKRIKAIGVACRGMTYNEHNIYAYTQLSKLTRDYVLFAHNVDE